MKKIIIFGGFLIMAFCIFSSCATFRNVSKTASTRFESCEKKTKTIQTSYGKMTYIEEGNGPVILSIHGICGGFDQAFETLENQADSYRVIAPSRFGYPGTEMPENASIETQCDAYCQLLDSLNLDKVYLLATSAGGTSAIKMALLHPERISGLILYCSAYPALVAPKKPLKYAGPPSPFCSDFAMWMISPLFKPIMGMPKETIITILPMKNRKPGILFDGKVTNTDAVNHPENYDLSKLQVPVLICHSKDDRLASNTETIIKWSERIPDCKLIMFENGGHLMEGNETQLSEFLKDFISY